MDNTSKQFDNDINDDKEEGVLHKNINYEVGILQKHSNTEMEEVSMESTCKQVDASKQVEMSVTLKMNERQKIHPTLFTMSNEQMKEILKKIIKQHQDESMITSQKQSSEPLPQLHDDDDDGSIDKSVSQVSQELNVSCQKDESNNDASVQVKEKLSNTRETLLKMSREEMKERLTKIVQQHQKEKVQDQSGDSSQQINCSSSAVDHRTTQPLNPIQQLIKDRINNWMEDKAICNSTARSIQQLNGSERQSIESSRISNVSEDKPALQANQDINGFDHKNEMKNKKVVKKRLRNTRGTMYQMNSESMTELRKIIKQHQEKDSTTLPLQGESIDLSQQLNDKGAADIPVPQENQQLNVSCQKDGMNKSKEVFNNRYCSTDHVHEIDQVQVKKRSLKKRGRNTRGTMYNMSNENMMELRNIIRQNQKDDSNKLHPQSTGFADNTQACQQLDNQKPENEYSISLSRKKYGVEAGSIKELNVGRKLPFKTKPRKNDSIPQTPIFRALIQLDSSPGNVKDITGKRLNILYSHKLTLPTIIEEPEDMQQISPPLENFSKEDTLSLSNKVSIHQPASIREYLALPETCKDDLQLSEKLKKILMSKTQWAKRVEKKKTKAELKKFLELTKQQMDAVVLETETDKIWVETQVNLNQNETDEFKQKMHKMVSRLETKLEENQQPLYLLRKEYERLTDKLASTKRWNIIRIGKLQQKINVITQSLTNVNDTNNSIMGKIAEYDFHYVNKTS